MFIIKKITETETDIIDTETVAECKTLKKASEIAEDYASAEEFPGEAWTRFIVLNSDEKFVCSKYPRVSWLKSQGMTSYSAIDMLVYGGVKDELESRGIFGKPKREDFDSDETFEMWLEDYYSNLKEITGAFDRHNMLRYLDEDGSCLLPEVVTDFNFGKKEYSICENHRTTRKN